MTDTSERIDAARVVAQATQDAAHVVADAAEVARMVVARGGRPDVKSIAVWVSLLLATVGGAVGYGKLQERVSSLSTTVVASDAAQGVLDRRLQETEKAVAVMASAVVEIRDMLRSDRSRRE